jgi:cbb3-type cytochrome oxidase maturation protein
MDILFLLVPVSVALVFVIGVFFRSAIRGGQFEDLEGPAYRILMDDDGVSRVEQDGTEDSAANPSANEPGV